MSRGAEVRRSGRSRRAGWWILAAAALVFAVGVGLWQAQAILRFRHPGVDQSIGMGEQAQVDGVTYRLTAFQHRRALPVTADLRDLHPSGLVSAPPGAELVQVVLTVERVDPHRDPDTVFCDLTLQDSGGRIWRSEGSIDYQVAGPAATSCLGDSDARPPVGTPYEVGQVFQLPALAVGEVTVRLRLDGGSQRQVLELRPH